MNNPHQNLEIVCELYYVSPEKALSHVFIGDFTGLDLISVTQVHS